MNKSETTIANINFLRKEEGDYIQICCDNPDPEIANDNCQVICAGFWTQKGGEWREIPFMGRTLEKALQNAVHYRKEWEKNK